MCIRDSLLRASKILLIIVKNRIKGQIQRYVDEDQFMLRPVNGNREAILSFKRRLERICNLYWPKKAFDHID